MKPLNMRYAQYHSKKTGRRGPLFMDRFKSIVTQEQNYIQELVRYVHLNPIRAGICKSLKALEHYPWCGHSVIMGKYRKNFQNVSTVLRCFASATSKARLLYCQFLNDGLNINENKNSLEDLIRKSNAGVEAGRKTSCWVIGDQKFVQKALSSAKASQLRVSRFEREGGGFEGLTKTICSHFNISCGMLQRRQRGGAASKARKAFAYIAAKKYNAPLKKIGDFLGVGSAAISAMVQPGYNIVNLEKIII